MVAKSNSFPAMLDKTPSDRGIVAEINQTPDVCGGQACIRATRIPVWTLVRLHKLGRTEVQLLADFPSLTHVDLGAAWLYYQANTVEVDALISSQEDDM